MDVKISWLLKTLTTHKKSTLVVEKEPSVGTSLTWAGGSRVGRGDNLEQNLIILSQSLFGQVALPLDLHLQRLGDIRYDPVDRSQHKEDDVLGSGKD